MALQLMPDGQTFRKLTATQTKALEKYYKREKRISLPLPSLGVALGVPLVLAVGIGSFAYLFKDEIQEAIAQQYDDFKDFLFSLPKEAAVWSGGGVADIILAATNSLSANNPNTPEFVTLNPGTPNERQVGPLSRCQRWENDANDWLAKSQAGAYVSTTGQVLAGAYIIKNMKKEGCPRPGSITQAQWDDV